MCYTFIVLILMIFDIDSVTLKSHPWKGIKLLRATRGARNSSLQVLITHASHVCRQHSFIWTATKNEQECAEPNMITRVLTLYPS